MSITLIKYYGYREKSTRNVFLVLPRSMVSELEKELLRQAEINQPENHITFVFMDEIGNEISVFLTDFNASFGTSVGPA